MAKRTRQKCQPLFAGRKRKERTAFQLFNTEYTHPSQSYLLLLLRTLPEQPDRVKETGTYDTQYRYILHIEKMHFRRNISDALLYIPNTFSRPTFPVKKIKRVGIRLRIIGINQAQQSRLACPVQTEQRPLFPVFHFPIQFFQDGTATIFDRNVFHPKSNEMGGRFFLILNRK